MMSYILRCLIEIVLTTVRYTKMMSETQVGLHHQVLRHWDASLVQDLFGMVQGFQDASYLCWRILRYIRFEDKVYLNDLSLHGGHTANAGQ